MDQNKSYAAPTPEKSEKNTSFPMYKQCPNHLVQYLETRDYLPQCSPRFIYVKYKKAKLNVIKMQNYAY